MSKLLYVTDHPFVRAHGATYDMGSFRLQYFQPLRDVFDIGLIGRIAESVDVEVQVDQLAAPSCVPFVPTGSLRGARWHLLGSTLTRRALADFTSQWGTVDCLWLRVPSVSGLTASRWASGLGVPYGLEVGGDPASSVLSMLPPSARSLGKLLRARFRRMVESAAAVAYTSEDLRHAYPPGADAPVEIVSNVDIPRSWFARYPRTKNAFRRPLDGLDVLMVSGLVPIKNHVKAIRGLAASESVRRLDIVGEGPERPRIEAEAARHSTLDVRLLGHVADRSELAAHLDASDFLLQASASEGLPRAALEALARGVPVVASIGAGLSSLLPSHVLFESQSPSALARVVSSLTQEQLAELSTEGLEHAQQFGLDVVQGKKRKLIRQLEAAI